MKKQEYEKLIDYIYEFCNINLVNPNEIHTLLEKCKLAVLSRYFDSTPSTYVLKKNGTIQKYDYEKVYRSIANASDSIGEPMTDGDINYIVDTAIARLKKDLGNIIPTNAIRNEVLNCLKEMGFKHISSRYNEF